MLIKKLVKLMGFSIIIISFLNYILYEKCFNLNYCNGRSFLSIILVHFFLIIFIMFFNKFKFIIEYTSNIFSNIRDSFISISFTFIFLIFRMDSKSGDYLLRIYEASNTCHLDSFYSFIPNCIMMSNQFSSYFNRVIASLLPQIPTEVILTSTSAISGGIFIYISLKISKLIFRSAKYKFLTILTLFSTISMGVFFGWVENFSLLYLFIALYVYLCLLLFNKPAHSHMILIAFVSSLAALTHGLGVLLFFPTAFLLIYHFKNDINTIIKSTFTYLLPIILISSYTFFTQFHTIENFLSPVYENEVLIGWSGLGTFSAVLTIGMVPLREIFSLSHLLGKLQIFILFSLAYVLIIHSIGKYLKKAEYTFFYTLIAPFLLFFILWKYNYNQSDWDLMGAYSIPLAFFTLFHCKSYTHLKDLYPILILSSLLSLFWLFSYS